MPIRPLLTLGLILMGLLSTPSFAQLNTVVGPPSVPMGGDLSLTFSNDYPHKFGITTNLWSIKDASGVVVYTPTGAPKSVLMGPGGWVTTHWNLRDQAGAPVPIGAYTLEVQFDFGAPLDTIPFSVQAEGAGLVFEGSATTTPPFGGGQTRNFYLTSPSDPGLLYLLLASTSSTTGTLTCGGVVPLDLSPLLISSLIPDSVFQQSLGTLNGKGESLAPHFDLPPNPAFVGLTLEAAFIVLDVTSPCLVRRISNAHSMTIL
jgi:hypothetical protein